MIIKAILMEEGWFMSDFLMNFLGTIIAFDIFFQQVMNTDVGPVWDTWIAACNIAFNLQLNILGS